MFDGPRVRRRGYVETLRNHSKASRARYAWAAVELMSTRADVVQQNRLRRDSSVEGLAPVTSDAERGTSAATRQSVAMHAVQITLLVISFVADTGPFATAITPTRSDRVTPTTPAAHRSSPPGHSLALRSKRVADGLTTTLNRAKLMNRPIRCTWRRRPSRISAVHSALPHPSTASHRAQIATDRRTIAMHRGKTATDRGTPTPDRSTTATDRSPTATDRSPTATDRTPTATDRTPTATDRTTTATDRAPIATDRATTASD